MTRRAARRGTRRTPPAAPPKTLPDATINTLRTLEPIALGYVAAARMLGAPSDTKRHAAELLAAGGTLARAYLAVEAPRSARDAALLARWTPEGDATEHPARRAARRAGWRRAQLEDEARAALDAMNPAQARVFAWIAARRTSDPIAWAPREIDARRARAALEAGAVALGLVRVKARGRWLPARDEAAPDERVTAVRLTNLGVLAARVARGESEESVTPNT